METPKWRQMMGLCALLKWANRHLFVFVGGTRLRSRHTQRHPRFFCQDAGSAVLSNQKAPSLGVHSVFTAQLQRTMMTWRQPKMVKWLEMLSIIHWGSIPQVPFLQSSIVFHFLVLSKTSKSHPEWSPKRAKPSLGKGPAVGSVDRQLLEFTDSSQWQSKDCVQLQNCSPQSLGVTIPGWLVVGPPLWKIWTSIGMIIPNIWENRKWQPNHQPAGASLLQSSRWRGQRILRHENLISSEQYPGPYLVPKFGNARIPQSVPIFFETHGVSRPSKIPGFRPTKSTTAPDGQVPGPRCSNSWCPRAEDSSCPQRLRLGSSGAVRWVLPQKPGNQGRKPR